MLTGRWPHELSVGWDRPLDGARPTLAEYLGGRGYATAGFVANTTYCSYETGLARGFAHYEDYDVTPRAVLLCSALVQRALNFADKHPAVERALALGAARPPSAHRKGAARINEDFLDWLSARGNRPFFAFLNYFDAHHPYLTPDREGEPAAFGRAPESADDFRTLRAWWGMDKRRLGPRERDLARDAYDRCIASLDRQLGRLLDELDRRGLLRETLVVVTADHGEHLGEQHLYGHGTSLYRPELHVPLVVLPPGRESGRVVREPVSLRDIPATVVDLVGLGDGSPFPGRPLSAGRPGAEPVLSEVEAPPEDDPNRGESPACLGPMTSLVGWGYHYIRNGDGREELFDLEADPGEAHNLAAAVSLEPFRAAMRR
jgi:arylsulfatase A-like enzyme